MMAISAREIAAYQAGRRLVEAPGRNRVQQYSRGGMQQYATGPGYPSSTSVVVPVHEASGNLVIGYSRNYRKFSLPNYVKYIQCEKNLGLYLKMSSQEQVRVVNTTDFRWGQGQPRPVHTDGLEQFNYQPFITYRYNYGASMDDDTERLATWPIVQQHSQFHATQLMTARTIRMLAVATTAANWNTTADPDLTANHTATATALAGGFFDQGTVTAPYIKIALDKIAVSICLETADAVNAKDLWYIINPNQARLWAESAEIRSYIANSYFAKEEVVEGLQPNNKFGLPSKLYGYNIMVETATKVTSRTGATLTKAFAMPDKTLLVASRPGGLMGVDGFSDFSTLSMFWYRDEITMQTKTDDWNRLVEIGITEQTGEYLTTPLSGWLVTLTTSVAS